jgi:nucleoside-diphosphate-sugar epimerase
MSILITGGCGYIGSELVKSLLKSNLKIKVVDLIWFDNTLKKYEGKNLTILKKDYRDLNKRDFIGVDSVIHLANVANDPSADLDPNLSWEINTLGMKILCDKCTESNIKRFIFASSGSVYGVKKERNVNEELSLEPISIYNKTKMTAERVLLSYSSFFQTFILRPATVCGISERMRLDLTVNILTYSALESRVIKVFGGNQSRPNINIRDMVRVYEHFLFKKCDPGIYNAGFENKKIINIAKLIQTKVQCEIKIQESNDLRSYRLNSDKLLRTGFTPKFGIMDAIDDITRLFAEKKISNKKKYYNINWLKKKNVK